jgi:hypothetical protein
VYPIVWVSYRLPGKEMTRVADNSSAEGILRGFEAKARRVDQLKFGLEESTMRRESKVINEDRELIELMQRNIIRVSFFFLSTVLSYLFNMQFLLAWRLRKRVGVSASGRDC